MTQRAAHPRAADRWGITSGYLDTRRRWHAVSAATRERLLAAIQGEGGLESSREEPSVRVLKAGGGARFREAVRLVGENGVYPAEGWSRRVECPMGTYRVETKDGRNLGWVLVSPGSCEPATGAAKWGWAVQVYALRSEASWGIGDFADLREFAGWSERELGSAYCLVNPLGAALPGCPQENSPYSPSSRLFLNPLYLRVEEVPGAAAAGRALKSLGEQGRALNARRWIDRDAVYLLKMRALEVLWRRFRGDAAFDAYCRDHGERGEMLRAYGIFCVLTERHGRSWWRWPEAERRPETAGRRLTRSEEDRVRFHQWVQWLLDGQLGRVTSESRLMLDVSIGVSREGFDAWWWQDCLALGMSVGVPPDEYNTLGQDWGLPPWIPHRLRARGYEPWRQTLRAMLRHAWALRVDHVMGLFRLYWIPCGASAAEGAFVRYAADEMLAVLATESRRAGAVVVGEDLGTVEAGVRRMLRQRNLLSYRLLWFERGRPQSFPREALASISTHDLFTIAGLWTGSDLADQERLGLSPNREGTLSIRRRLAWLTGMTEAEADVESVVWAAHRALRRAPCRLFTASLEDALGVAERPNMPGTVDAWPNWRWPLPVTLEGLRGHAGLRRIAAVMRGGRGRRAPELTVTR